MMGAKLGQELIKEGVAGGQCLTYVCLVPR